MRPRWPRNSLRARRIGQRNSEYGERIEHQAATIDVLKAMSASPGDPQPVFDLIVRRARNCAMLRRGHCSNSMANLSTLVRVPVHDIGTRQLQAYTERWPTAPDRGSITCRAILDRADHPYPRYGRRTRIFPDRAATGAQVAVVDSADARRQAIGAISTCRQDPGGFSDSQIELLKTFAEQAVIAISSAETYRALQTRTADLQELLEYQTATSDVLKVISRAAYDLDTVLIMLLVTAERLCEANHGQIWRKDGEAFRYAASHMNVPAYREKKSKPRLGRAEARWSDALDWSAGRF